MHGCPAVEQDACDESYWYEGVDGAEESVGIEAADDAAWYA